MTRATFLDGIDSPSDLKKLNPSQLPQLAREIREYIKEFTGKTGGHIGSGMGVVELTVALHYLFDFAAGDHLVLDVGHQCYPHKILTGRRHRMETIRQMGGLSGFPDPSESVYDAVKTGHGGTSLTTAVGMAVALKQQKPKADRRVVAMIGDAGLQEGVALEALNHAGSFEELPLLIVLNDNEHGIGPAVGAMRRYFSQVRSGTIYRKARGRAKRIIRTMEERHPLFGRVAHEMVDSLKHGVHGLLPTIYPGALFESLNFFYYGPIDGHHLPTLLHALKDCKDFRRPVVLHCITTKGKGFSYKEDRLAYHAGKPAKELTAHLPLEFSDQGGPSYTDIFVEEAMAMAREDDRITAITAAMLEGTGLVKFKQAMPDRCFDVGMAEQHAVGMAQGLALAGRKPICAVYSTFMQRAIDQLFQELALIRTPVLLCLDRAGLVGPDGATHNGVFDIAYCRMFPNMAVMAPRDATEMRAMMRFGMELPGPAAIRYPRTKTALPEKERPATPLVLGQAETLEAGQDGALIAYGAMVYPALDIAHELHELYGWKLAVINARFAKPLDRDTLKREFERQPLVVTLEDHVKAGGFGSAVLEEANEMGLDTSRLRIIAIEDRWIDHGHRVEALMMAGLDVKSLVAKVADHLKTINHKPAAARGNHLTVPEE